MAPKRSNKRSKNNNKEPVKADQESSSSWSDMPEELLLDIFLRLDRKFLFWVISLVSRRWQQICWEYLFCKDDILVLFDLNNFIDIAGESGGPQGNYDQVGIALNRVLGSIFDGNGDLVMRSNWISIDEIMLPAFPLVDKHLIYTAERTMKIQRVSIPNMTLITGKGFSRAIRQWKQLKVLGIGHPHSSHISHIINEIGINCKNLNGFWIFSRSLPNTPIFALDEYTSLLIAKCLPRSVELVHLTNCDISELGLKTLLKKSKQLKVVRIIRCSRIDKRSMKKPPVVLGYPISFLLSRIEGSTEWFIQKDSEEKSAESEISLLWSTTESHK